MMLFGNIKMALGSIRNAKWRSLLTMLGIIIGVASVVTIVSLGEGVKQQVSDQLEQFGPDLITIRPGKIVNDENNTLEGLSLFSSNLNVLSDNDVKVVAKAEGVYASAPFSLVNGIVSYDNRQLTNVNTIATTADLPVLLNKEVQFGAFFGTGDEGRNVAVIGSKVAEELFQEIVPTGKTFHFRGEDFIVRGVFEEFDNMPFSPISDYNRAIFIPYTTGQKLNNGVSHVFEILVKPENPEETAQLANLLRASLLQTHGGQDDFSILRQGETVAVADNVLTLLTSLVAGVAAISLLVGGIGVMNIMLVAVTERTHEIGIRKAVGATNRQILNQFVTEAIMLSIVGSIIGIIVALAANGLLRITTDLQPQINFRVMGLAVLSALAVGIIFGIAPAAKAARKDPIEALRYE